MLYPRYVANRNSSTVIATRIGPLTHTLPATLNDRPDSSNDDGIPPPAPVRLSSMLFPAVSKCKQSTLDDDAASVSSYASKQSHNLASSGVSVLHGIKDMMEGISSSMRNGSLGLGLPHHHRRSSTERQIEAMTFLQGKEDLMVDQIIAFADLFKQNASKADTYMALIRDDVWKLWVQKQLVELGFPMVAGASEA
jgi:hypothetical protein